MLGSGLVNLVGADSTIQTLGNTWHLPFIDSLSTLGRTTSRKLDLRFPVRHHKIYALEKITLHPIITDCDPIKHELPCFTDTSIHAYAATVYLVTEKDAGERVPRLIAAKAKNASIKTISLPRLELCGEQFGAKTTDK